MSKDLMGTYVCPHCGNTTVVIWNGNRRTTCPNCGKAFIVKRQRIRNVEVVKRATGGGRS